MKNKVMIKYLRICFAFLMIIHFFFVIGNMGSVGRSFFYIIPIYAPIVIINFLWTFRNIKRFSYTLFLFIILVLWIWFIYFLASDTNTINLHTIVISFIIMNILNIILLSVECLLNKYRK